MAMDGEKEMQEKRLDIGSSVRRGFSILKDNPIIFAPIIACALIGSAEISHMHFLLKDLQDPQDIFQQFSLFDSLQFLVLALIGIFLFNLIIRMVYDATQEKVSLSEGVKTASIKFLPVLGATILSGLIVGLGTIALVIPGIFLATKLIYFQEAILIDNEGVISSLKKSWRIVKGNWWRTFGLVFIFSIIIGIISGGSYSSSNLSVSLGSGFIAYLFYGWMYSALVVAYLQLTRT